MAVSAVGYACWLVWFYYRISLGESEFRKDEFSSIYTPTTLSPLLLSVILTGLFLHLDRLCVCCPCTGVPGEEISVYDPSTDKRLLLVNSNLVEPPEVDMETGDTPSSSFCGCCSPAQEQNAGDIALAVINEQQGEVFQMAEDIVERDIIE